MNKTKYKRAFLMLAVAMTAPQAAMAINVCEGEYTMDIGDATPAISGPVSGVPNPLNTDKVVITMEDCGRTLLFDDGEITVTREDINSMHFSGTHQGGPISYDALSHDHVTGQLVITGTGSGVIFEMKLIEGRAPSFEGCDDPDAKDEIDDEDRLTVDPELRKEAIEIVAARLGIPPNQAESYIYAERSVAKTRQADRGITEILPGEPGCPIELEGVRTCRVHPPETTSTIRTNVLLDEDGKLLPIKTKTADAERLQVDDPGRADYCTPEATYPEADKRLQFRFFAIDEDGINDVQGNLIDAESDRIEKSHYVDGLYGGYRGRSQGADEVYYAVGSPVTGLHRLPQ